ncbi:beta strand repeat-containing protein [Anabaena cylindrica]
MGHLAGIINGYSEFDRHIQTINNTKHFITNNITATLTPDGSHLDPKAHPYDLMNNTLSPGVRKLPSLLNLQILNTVRNNTTPSNITTLTAPLNSDPLIGILNGDFDSQTDWTTRGATTILNSHAVLTEDSPLLSNLTQTFIIPEHAKYLQFTILDTQLGTNTFAPNDAFEVALLDAQTLTPLLGTATGLTQTDSLLNLQQTGNAYFSNNVKIAGANTSGDKIALNTPRTVNIDISNIAPGTVASLYFDLLGFGAKDAQVIIDNVILLNDDLITPIANNDTATTDQGQPLLINVLANDSTPNGTVQLGTAANGSIIINPDSTLTYTPNNNFIGTDTFTYIILDNNAISNEATVSVTVNNIAPTINNVTVESNIQEGTISTFSATATDPGNDLTYNWNFGDGTDTVIGQNVNHIFVDNGIYTVTFTVNDTNGANTSQTITANVSNIAPVVQAGVDITTDEGTAITFNGNFNDPGILDTHTITWDFGDNSTATGILNPTHTYTKDGIYTATLTVQDNDGGTSSNSLTVTVNNTDLIITNISADTNVNEGAVANFSATATDPGNDLTYTWNFGDGTNAVIGQNVNHIFAEDGSYIVTLTVSDTNGGTTSETLSVQVNNAAPIITNISGDSNINEGATANFTATATDPGNDTITYTWNFGDGTDAIIGENINHIFTEDGIYTVTLTVSDSEGANTFQTLTTNVSNVAPIVEAGVNQTIYTSETVNFNGQFTDPGILDTHTITWDFGDGNTTTGILNPSHIYTTDGTYTATLTITDNDHAVSNDIMTVTVQKPPSISVSDVSIIEGDNGEKLAIFTANLSEVSTRDISVNYTTADGTATAGSDYTATNGTLTFAPGETTKTVSVQIIGDALIESDETFNINLSNATNATIADAIGVGTILNNDLPLAFAIKAEGTVTINNGGDFDGNPLDLSDDALIYAGKGFTINGNPTLPVQRDAQGNPIHDSNGKLVLVDRAVTVAPGYTVTNGPSNQYANLLPPQVVDKQTINIPVYADIKQLELNRRIPANTPTVTFNVSQNPMNNANDWAAKFPPPGTATNPTVVRVTGGGLNVPSGITISNYVIIVEQGDINFNGNGHNFNNVVLVSNNGNINLSNLQAQNLSVFASGSINMNGGARFAGSTLMANNSGNITFNGATTTTDAASNLQVISSGDITYNGAANTRGTFQAVKNFNYNSSSTLFGTIEVKGNITFNSAATVIAVGS